MLRLALAAVFLALAAPAASAPLTLLTEENPPFNYSEGGRLTGLVTELVQEAARRANVPVTVEVLPWARAYTRAQAERDTCVFATARLDHRERLFLWVGPLASNVWGVFGKGDWNRPVQQLPDLKPFRIGGVTSDAKADYLRDNGITNLRLVAEDRLNPPRLFLPAGDPDHIDLWVTGYFGARTVARAAGRGDVKLVFVARDIPLYLACSPQTAPATVRALADAVEAMRAEGVLARTAGAYEKKFAQ
jgi:polar amino acid transport system substrate-binding protein